MNTAITYVQDQGAAEDISQEVFITIYKSILSFNEQSSLSTWIYRVTVNKCLDHLRAGARQKRSGFLIQLFHRDSGAQLVEKPDFIHPGIVLEQRENSKYLFKALDKLPVNQKTAFILTHIEDLPQKEVADIMNISVKAVESILQRAKVNLRKYLADMKK